MIDSIDAQRFLTLVTGADRPALIEFLLGGLERLARAGEVWRSSLVGRMIERDGIEAVILGGTELGLLFRGSDLSAVPTLDTTSIHVEGVIERLLA